MSEESAAAGEPAVPEGGTVPEGPVVPESSADAGHAADAGHSSDAGHPAGAGGPAEDLAVGSDPVAGGEAANAEMPGRSEEVSPEQPSAEQQPSTEQWLSEGRQPAGEQDESAVEQSAPDLDADETLDAALEALLLVVDVPAGEELLASTLEQPVARIRSALQRLSESYASAGRGIDLRRVGDGWRFYTRDTYAPYVERYLLDGQRSKLTRAALETLAVISYRQPVTRSRVAAVRGVNVDGVVRTLLARGLIEEAGTEPETGGTFYCTTELFLERLGLSSLKDLPPLAPLLPEVDAIDDV